MFQTDEITPAGLNQEEGAFPLHVLTNSAGLNGAACILYPRILKNLRRACEGWRIYPSLKHPRSFVNSRLLFSLCPGAESDCLWDQWTGRPCGGSPVQIIFTATVLWRIRFLFPPALLALLHQAEYGIHNKKLAMAIAPEICSVSIKVDVWKRGGSLNQIVNASVN